MNVTLTVNGPNRSASVVIPIDLIERQPNPAEFLHDELEELLWRLNICSGTIAAHPKGTIGREPNYQCPIHKTPMVFWRGPMLMDDEWLCVCTGFPGHSNPEGRGKSKDVTFRNWLLGNGFIDNAAVMPCAICDNGSRLSPGWKCDICGRVTFALKPA
jgi:hypothetical protein